MGQYQPQYLVGSAGADGEPRYSDIHRQPTRDEIARAYAAARAAGRWRFDQRN
jgi:hypothetical protein